jgi:hypothetical protein
VRIDFRLSLDVEEGAIKVSYAPIDREAFSKGMKKLSLWQIGYVQSLLRVIEAWAKKHQRITVRKAKKLAKLAQK